MGNPISPGLLELILGLLELILPLLVDTPLPLPFVMALHLLVDTWAGHLADIRVGLLPLVLGLRPRELMEPQDPHREWTLNSSLGFRYVCCNYEEVIL